jgi:hypothetical protein
MEGISLSDALSFDSRYALPAMMSNVEVADFQLENFPRADDAEPLPDPAVDMTLPAPGPLPDPFEEFEVERKKISELLTTPSLDDLFKPFDLDKERPQAEFQDMADFAAPTHFD